MTGTVTPDFIAPQYRTFRAWVSVAILLLFSLVSIMDRQIIALLVGPIKAALGLSDTQFGLLQGIAFALMYSLAGLPIGWAVDRFSRRVIIYAGVTLWSLSTMCCGLARSFWPFFGGRACVGVGEASVAPVAVSLIGDLFPPHKVGLALGLYAAGFSIGSGVALGLGGWVISLFSGSAQVHLGPFGVVASWQAVLIVIGLPGLVVATLAVLLHEPPRRYALVTESAGRMITDDIRQYLAVRGGVVAYSFAAFTLTTLCAYAIGGWTPAFLTRTYGWGPTEIGASFGFVLMISGALGSLAGGWIIDRVYRRGMRDACFVVAATAALGAAPFLVAGYFMPSAAAALGCLAVGLLLLGTIASASYSTWQLIAPPRLRGRVTSAFVLCASLGGTSIGPLAVGLTTDRLFRDEAMVGKSIALVLAVSLPLVAFLLLRARAALRAAGTEDLLLDHSPRGMLTGER
jgi:MFS family permease